MSTNPRKPRLISTVLDGIPAVVDVVEVGPASPTDIDKLWSKLEKNAKPKAPITVSITGDSATVGGTTATNTSYVTTYAPDTEPTFVTNPVGTAVPEPVGNIVPLPVGTTPPITTEGAVLQNKLDQNGVDPIDLLIEIGNALEELPEDKTWYQSKTVWVNIFALVTAIAAYFGFDLQIGEQAYLFLPAAVGLLNIVLRMVTKTGIEAPVVTSKRAKKMRNDPKDKLLTIRDAYLS